MLVCHIVLLLSVHHIICFIVSSSHCFYCCWFVALLVLLLIHCIINLVDGSVVVLVYHVDGCVVGSLHC
jgi:hypothetical protein